MFSDSLKSKWILACVYSLCTTLLSLSISLQAPFYPKVAESKGASSSLYGIVFGVFGFIIMVFCPIYGKTIPFVGAKLVSYIGVFTAGVCNILFGFVDKINGTSTFIGLSLAIRIVEAVGYAGFRTASISIISNEFSDSVEVGFALVQSSFGFGIIIGPAIGGVLYEIGGFILPFSVVGSGLLFATIVIFCLPFKCDYGYRDDESENGFKGILNSSTTLLGMFNIFVAYLIQGLLETVLEPHIRQFNLPPRYVGLMFACIALSFSVSSFLCARICSKWDCPELLWSTGALLCIFSLLLLGPAPYFTFNLNIGILIVSLVIFGIGEGAQTVGGFVGINKAAAHAGFPKSIQTHSLISTLYMCSVTAGFVIGSILSGFLYDYIGFRWATQLFCVLLIIIILLTFIKNVCNRS